MFRVLKSSSNRLKLLPFYFCKNKGLQSKTGFGFGGAVKQLPGRVGEPEKGLAISGDEVAVVGADLNWLQLSAYII